MSTLSKQALTTAFNKKFLEFLDDLIQTFPEDRDFRTFKSTVVIIINIDARKLRAVFNIAIPKYKKHIMERDDQFFLANSYEELQEVDVDKQVTDELINKLKTYWVQLDETNRETIWKYLTLLVALNDRCALATSI